MRKSMLFVCIIFLLVVNLFGAEGTGVLTGKVVDEKTNEPIPNVKVEIDNTINPKVIDAYNTFAFDIFNEIYSPDSNHFISPMSIQMALSMVMNGANKETFNQLEKGLYFEGFPIEDINEANKNLIKSINSSGDKSIEIDLLNSLWVNNCFSFKDSFLDVNRKFYDAAVEKRDFSKDDVLLEINKYIEDKTHGKFKDLLKELPSAALLMNIIYFKGKWKECIKFDEKLTREENFNISSLKSKKVQMMFKKWSYNYLETEKFQAVELPYGKGRYSMYVFLPKKIYSLKKLIKNLKLKEWKSFNKSFRFREGELKFPKLKLKYSIKLKEVLKSLGMKDMFSEQKANLSNMIKFNRDAINFYISYVNQDSFVEINEKGTEAIAITTIDIVPTCIQEKPKPFKMHVNRPYFFMIVDNKTGLILFMGAIKEPVI